MDEDYHIVKTSLKSILNNNNNIYELLNDSILKINNLVAHLYQFFRSLFLYEYKENCDGHENKNTPINYKFTMLTREIIQIGVKVLTKDINSGKLNKEMDNIYNYFNKFYEDHYKHLGYINKIDGNNLSQSMKYEAIHMMTAIHNNIIYNFDKYVQQYVTVSFYENHKLILLLTNEKDRKDKKKQLYYELSKVCNDLLNDTFTSKEYYWNWIKKHKQIILPSDIKTSYSSDINHNPQKYMPYMIVMSKYLEKFGKAKYQFFPLRTSGIPNYCTFDTTCLIKLLIKNNNNRNTYLANVSEYQDVVWDLCFNINGKIFRKNKYKFDYTILTDGYGVSIRFISEKQYQRNSLYEERKKMSKELNKIVSNIQDPIEKSIILKQLDDIKEDKKFENKLNREEFIKNLSQDDKEKFKRGKIEFPYIDELTNLELKELSESIRVYNDPGKRHLIKMKDENGTEFSYSNKQRLKEMNSEKYANQINKFWGLEIKPSTKKRKRKSKKKRKKKGAKNKNNSHIPGKKENLQSKKNKRKHCKTTNIDNNSKNIINKEKLNITECTIMETLNNLMDINIKEQKFTTINNDHFMDILKNNPFNYTYNDKLILEYLISFAILNQNRSIYNKYGIERKKILKQIKLNELNIAHAEKTFNKTYISMEKLITKIIELNKFEDIQLFSKNEKSIKSTVTSLYKLNQSNYNIKQTYTNLLDQIINFDNNYNNHEILDEKLRDIVNTPIDFNSLDPLINFEKNILNCSASEQLKIRELCISYKLSNNTIFSRLRNILKSIKSTIYGTLSKNQESTINKFIETEKLRELLITKQNEFKNFMINNVNGLPNLTKKVKENTINIYLKELSLSWIRNMDVVKDKLNTISHPDSTYISFLVPSSNIIKQLVNKKAIALCLEHDLSCLRKRSCNISQFEYYITYKNYIRHSEYGDIYTDPIFRRCRWYSYIDKSRSLDNLVNRIERVFGPRDKITIIYGDWSVSKQLRNFKPTPMISLKRKLHNRFKIYNIDEFRTSLLSAKTGKVCENIKLSDKHGQLRSIHSVLTYKSGLRQNCINRDSNALLNFEHITRELLAGNNRPLRFCRSTKLETIINTSNPILMASNGGATRRSSISMAVLC